MTDPRSLSIGLTGHTHTTRLTVTLARDTARLMNEDPKATPVGIAFVLALRTVISWGKLSDGAVMIDHRSTWFRPMELGGISTTVLSIVRLGEPSSRYREITLGYRTYLDNDEMLIEQEQKILWPIVV
jgi:hypothetical protein